MSGSAVDLISNAFPNLRKPDTFKVTSQKSSHYNCIAYAAGDEKRVWWPLGTEYWPPNVPRATTLQAFEQAFTHLGFETCQTGDLEEGFQKVAIFGRNEADIQHAAKQLKDGRWSSKLGPQWDIRHNSVDGVTGARYGTVLRFMKRQIPQEPSQIKT